ncbi:RQC domain-containing protein [Virgibacillus salarius]|uniref:RQC domain-containing protein n=1 Tax=Virgibacillus salarius TaxID=447199 RepID=UPI002491EE82|nr:RQC domain-containing protein [Virgibacillus salarius]WBX79241.1 RQC domain-containing protein [Virgibacillus salarius]
MILDGIILTSTSYLNKERSISAIFHIITGKKSIQTVQDIHMYQLKSFYGVYPSLDKAVFQKQIRYLIKEDCLRICNEEKQIYKLTPVGSRRLNEVGESSTLKLLNGFRFAKVRKNLFR